MEVLQARPATGRRCRWCDEPARRHEPRWRISGSGEWVERPFRVYFHPECRDALEQWSKRFCWDGAWPDVIMPRGEWDIKT